MTLPQSGVPTVKVLTDAPVFAGSASTLVAKQCVVLAWWLHFTFRALLSFLVMLFHVSFQ